MGFIRQQHEKLAAQLLRWRYAKLGLAPPPAQQLDRQARQTVDAAAAIARERGRNILTILKETIANLKNQ